MPHCAIRYGVRVRKLCDRDKTVPEKRASIYVTMMFSNERKIKNKTKILHAANALIYTVCVHRDSVWKSSYTATSIDFELSKCAHAFAKSRCINLQFHPLLNQIRTFVSHRVQLMGDKSNWRIEEIHTMMNALINWLAFSFFSFHSESKTFLWWFFSGSFLECPQFQWISLSHISIQHNIIFNSVLTSILTKHRASSHFARSCCCFCRCLVCSVHVPIELNFHLVLLFVACFLSTGSILFFQFSTRFFFAILVNSHTGLLLLSVVVNVIVAAAAAAASIHDCKCISICQFFHSCSVYFK